MKINFLRTTVASVVLILVANSPAGTCEIFFSPFPAGLYGAGQPPNQFEAKRERFVLKTIMFNFPMFCLFALEVIA
jgi:hypothetical protein